LVIDIARLPDLWCSRPSSSPEAERAR